MRNLVLIFGDQLDKNSSALDDFDPDQDAVWMAEAEEESRYAPSHKHRIVLFLSAMRHFRQALEERGYTVHYQQLDDKKAETKLSGALRNSLDSLKPEKVVLTYPGEYRILKGVEVVCGKSKVPLEVRKDRHFLSTPEDFADWADGRKSLTMEYFYRDMRKREGILMKGKDPAGGEWNFDKENRGTFGKEGPSGLPHRRRFRPDAITEEVQEIVESHFPDHPGSVENFDWPVTREEALRALNHFIRDCLPTFGRYQDAMWTKEPYLYHALISSSLNLKLLDPREVIEKAEKAYAEDSAPIAAVEGFVRQILGWREYIRGIYWKYMPEYLEMNAMGAEEPLPEFYWTGETELACLKHTVGDTLKNGYAHHIQRLMVTGLYALLLGVRPREIEDWYLGIYVDAVEWVTLPNTLGMSQFADGGIMGSKPYIATGKYIQRMSNYCSECPKNPAKRVGEDACPFTTLYWDYLLRHEDTLKKNQRMALQVRNLDRLKPDQKKAIRKQADAVRKQPEGICSD